MKRTWDQMCEMLEEQAKEIEKLNKLLSVEQISNQGKQEEIERLKKEKEWLVWRVVGDERYGLFSSGKAERIRVLNEMQQALRDK